MKAAGFKKIQPALMIVDDVPDEVFTNKPTITPEFLLGGRATFEVVNLATGKKLAFKVRKLYPPHGLTAPDRYHVNVISVPYEQMSERYLGALNPETGTIRTDANSKFLPETPEYQTAAWAIQSVLLGKTIPTRYLIRHCGSCALCGNPLFIIPERDGMHLSCLRLHRPS